MHDALGVTFHGGHGRTNNSFMVFFTTKQLSHPLHTSLACWVFRRFQKRSVPRCGLQRAYKHHLAWLPSVSPEWNFPLDCLVQGCAERKVGRSEGFCLSLSYCVAHEANVCQLPRASTPNLPSGVERKLSSVAPWICPALCESVLQTWGSENTLGRDINAQTSDLITS